MKLNLNNEDTEKLYKLLETKQDNISIADLLNNLCFSFEPHPNIYKNGINDKNINKNSIDLIYDLFELDPNNSDNTSVINSYLSDSFKHINLNEYNDNPYKNSVKIKETTQNSYKLHYLTYNRFSYFPYKDVEVDESNFYKEKTTIGISNEDYSFLTLSKNNNIWMCITPNEINTMKHSINKAHDNVITFGLGLGYYAYMVSLKKEVTTITIVERDEEIINLFNECILPHFEFKNKIRIIKEDAIEYIKETKLANYDYAFFDLWHNAEDGLPLYLQIKKLEIIPPQDYWIEESLICMYRRCVLTVFEESLYEYSDDAYRKAKNSIDKIINELYFKTKNIRFKSYEEIHNFISKNNLLKLMQK